jgi:hypothetical protein
MRIVLAALALAAAIAFAADQIYADRALPGVSVAGVPVGSLTRDAMLDRLQSELAGPWAQSTIVATYDGRSWTTTNGALGVRPDVGAAADAAIAYGKNGQVIDRLSDWADALRGDARVAFTLKAEGNALDGWLTRISSDVDRAAVSGSLATGPTGLVITEPVVGRQLDRVTTAATVLAAQSLQDRTIDLSVRAVYPAVDASGFDEALAKARAATTALTVSVEDRRVSEDAAGLASLLVIERVVAKPGELAATPAGAILPATRYRYTVTLDETRVTEWVKALGAKLDRPAVPAKYSVSKDGALSIIAGVNGIRLDQPKMKRRRASSPRRRSPTAPRSARSRRRSGCRSCRRHRRSPRTTRRAPAVTRTSRPARRSSTAW